MTVDEGTVLNKLYEHLLDNNKSDVADLIFNVFSWNDEHAIKKMKTVLWKAIKNNGVFTVNWMETRTICSRVQNLKYAYTALDDWEHYLYGIGSN